MSASRREEARLAVLAFLAGRMALSHSPSAVLRGVNREGHDFNEQEIRDALSFVVGMGHATEDVEGYGISRYYRATPAGVLHWERGGGV